MVDQRRHPVDTRARYGPQLATLLAGIAALAAFDATHHPAGPAAPHASVRPAVTGTPHASPAGTAPTGRGAQPPAPGTHHASTELTGTPGPSRSPAPTPPGPSPSPEPKPGLAVTAIVVAPLRGATPVTARSVLVVPAAPPFPDAILRVGLNLALH
jgi:hypothetical protein